jgi:non-ribosomal peptide synthetase component F
VAACVILPGLADGLGRTPVVLVGTPGGAAPVAVTSDDLAYGMPTSGTTGEPNLVGVPHRVVTRLVHRSRTVPLDHTDRTLLSVKHTRRHYPARVP